MGIKYTDFAIRGIDTSLNNGDIDASKVDARFWIHRVGYGRTIDSKFVINWNNSTIINNTRFISRGIKLHNFNRF